MGTLGTSEVVSPWAGKKWNQGSNPGLGARTPHTVCQNPASQGLLPHPPGKRGNPQPQGEKQGCPLTSIVLQPRGVGDGGVKWLQEVLTLWQMREGRARICLINRPSTSLPCRRVQDPVLRIPKHPLRPDPGLQASLSQLQVGAESTAEPEGPAAAPASQRQACGHQKASSRSSSWCRAAQEEGLDPASDPEGARADSLWESPQAAWALPKPQPGGFRKAQRGSQNPLSPLQRQRQ